MAAVGHRKAVLRRLLKAVHKHVTCVADNTQWRDWIMCKAREPGTPAFLEERTQIANCLAFYISTVHEHRTLLQRYNIGIDPEERNKAMVEKVANRVGFALPERHR